jgi:hypothetical protein
MRNILIVLLMVFGCGFVLLNGYAVRTIFRDFGEVAGVLASLSFIAGLIGFAALLDSRPPRGP